MELRRELERLEVGSSGGGVREVRPHITIQPSITINIIIITTRPKPAYGRQGLDWIVWPGYSFVVFSTNKTMETNQKP